MLNGWVEKRKTPTMPEFNSPSEKQKEALSYLGDDITNFVGYGGAAFGGKSYLGCTWITHMAIEFPGTRWGLCRKELVTLKKTTLKTLFKVFGEMELEEGDDYKFNGQLNVITFKNGSEIVLIDMAYKPSDPLFTRFGGYELTGAFVDESNECEENAIMILFTRLGRCLNDQYNITVKLLETFNPQKNHVYNRYYKTWKDGVLPDNIAFIKALPTDNPSPEAAKYVETIVKNADTVTIERLINGNFEYDDDPTILIDYDSIVDSFTNKHVFNEHDKKYITADIAFHGSDLFVVFVWCGWTIIDCVAMSKSSGKEVENVLKSLALKHKVPQSQIIYDADGIGSFLKGYLENARSFNNGAKAIEQKQKDMNYQNLKAQCYFLLAERINNAGVFIKDEVGNMKINSIFVRDHIISESPAIKKDNTGDGKLRLISKEEMKKLIGHSPDFLDSMMMRVFFDLKPSGFKAPRMKFGTS